uniref:RRM domain-containing protein n=1 Tax=Electrophorus electricus TaxID=8005 RepID=A0AAY5EC29_ELEEL
MTLACVCEAEGVRGRAGAASQLGFDVLMFLSVCDASGLVFSFRMESTETCEAVIQHLNGKYLKTPPAIPAPAEPLLCKFADGGQKKRQTQSKYPQSTRAWHREGETGVALTYDPAVMQNGFYSSPYSFATNRMIAQTSITPFIAASPVSTYQTEVIFLTPQVQSTSWMPHQQYVMQPTGAVISPALEHTTVSMQPTHLVAPLTQQMNHLSLGSTGLYAVPSSRQTPRVWSAPKTSILVSSDQRTLNQSDSESSK